MLEEITVIQVRKLLESAGIKTSKIRKNVTDAIFAGKIKQRTRFSTILVPGELSLESFLNEILKANQTSWDKVDYNKLNDDEKEILAKIV